MKTKKQARLRRAMRSRAIIRRQKIARLTVHRTPRHFYAQIIAPTNDKVLLAVSTVGKQFKTDNKATGNIKAAAVLGKQLAQLAKKAKITKVAFDRSGFKFHGRVKAFAEAARAGGIEF